MVYDYIVIGSGFGGSVAALRLAEKGYSVCVIESGKRWQGQDFPKTNWTFWKFLWAPALFCYGIQRIQLLNDVLILGGSGVGDEADDFEIDEWKVKEMDSTSQVESISFTQ